MSQQGLSIAQAARSLGVSTRTVRRFIKSGKIEARLLPGPFGEEYRIFDLPPGLHRTEPVDSTPVQFPVQPPVQFPVQPPVQIMDIVRELQEKNLALAAQLGAASERIRSLDGQVKLLTTARQPWWRRLLTKKG